MIIVFLIIGGQVYKFFFYQNKLQILFALMGQKITLIKKIGTPTMGGVININRFIHRCSVLCWADLLNPYNMVVNIYITIIIWNFRSI